MLDIHLSILCYCMSLLKYVYMLKERHTISTNDECLLKHGCQGISCLHLHATIMNAMLLNGDIDKKEGGM